VFAPVAGAAVAEWQSVGFVFVTAGGALALLGGAVAAARVPVGVGVGVGLGAERAASASSGSDQMVAAVPAVMAGAAKANGRAPNGARPPSNKEEHMSNMDTLRAAGIAVSDDQADAIETLSPEEADTLAKIKAKLDSTDEVSGHARSSLAGDGGIVW